jgi:iron complex outermembrane receptor protein
MKLALMYSAVAAITVPASLAHAETAAGEAPAVQEIIVTAQRRSERLQDVPLSVEVATARSLELRGVTTTVGLTETVPGLVFGLKGGFTQPVIRGISTQGTGPGLDQAVPIYIDGVYQSNTTGGLLELADVSRIEVLKGPQGTLFGRNSTGGAIQIFTRDPEFKLASTLMGGYGSYDDARGSLFLTAPIVADVLAGSVSAFYRSNDGYNEDVLRGGHIGSLKSTVLRGKLLYRPLTWASFTLAASTLVNRDLSAFAGQGWNGNTEARRVNPTGYIPTRPREVALDVYPNLDVHQHAYSLRSVFDTGAGTVTALSSFTDTVVHIRQDSDYGPGFVGAVDPYNYHTDTRIHEVNFATRQFGRFRSVTGLYYYHDYAETAPLVLYSPLFPRGILTVDVEQVTTARAAYGEGTFDITDKLSITGGVRYSKEAKDYNGARAFGSTNRLTRQPIGSRDWSAWTPRVSVQYRLTDHINSYVTYSEGFKSGGFNATSLLNAPVDPEKNLAWEAGLKSVFGWGSLNVAAYHYDYKNLQVATLFGATSRLQNAASAEVKGIDANVSWNVTDHLELMSGVALTDAKYLDFKGAVVNVPKSAAQCAPVAAPCGNLSAFIDASGKPLIRAPKFTGNLMATYRMPAFSGELQLSANGYWNSGFSWEPNNRVRQSAYSLLGANVAWEPSSAKYRLSAFVKNITDENYMISETDAASGDGIAWGPPRWYGAQVEFHF